ncbi:MAG: RNA polymerase sigma factor [Pirellulales bacterium]
MEHWPPTQATLLVRVRDRNDHEAWKRFVDIYTPVVYGYARRQGLQDADAADLTQDVMRSVAAAIPEFRYDRQRGTFRGWLFTVARNKLRNFLTAAGRRERASGGSDVLQMLGEVPDPDANDHYDWDEEYARQLFAWAAECVQDEFAPTTWQAFWQNGVEGKAAAAVGKDLGLSVGAVYVAKCRVVARLRKEIEAIED